MAVAFWGDCRGFGHTNALCAQTSVSSTRLWPAGNRVCPDGPPSDVRLASATAAHDDENLDRVGMHD
jgi:hypothetical protein